MISQTFVNEGDVYVVNSVAPQRKHQYKPRKKHKKKKQRVQWKRTRLVLTHGEKARILQMYRKNRQLFGRFAMSKTLAALHGSKMTKSDYNNYRNQIYRWQRQESIIAADSCKKNGLQRKYCVRAVKSGRRVLNDISRAKIKAILDENRRVHKIRTSKNQVKQLIYDQVQRQLVETNDAKEAQKLIEFKNSETHFQSLMKDIDIRRQKTAVSKTMESNISSLNDPRLTTSKREEITVFLNGLWFDVCKYNITRDRFGSGDQMLAFWELRNDYTYCTQGEGASLMPSSYRAGITYTIFSIVFGTGNPAYLTIVIKTESGGFGPKILQLLTEDANFNDIIVLPSKSGKMVFALFGCGIVLCECAAFFLGSFLATVDLKPPLNVSVLCRIYKNCEWNATVCDMLQQCLLCGIDTCFVSRIFLTTYLKPSKPLPGIRSLAILRRFCY